jgi:twitching motility protein PilT
MECKESAPAEQVKLEINDRVEPKVATATARLDQWLKMLVAEKGSDLLLIPGAPASIRLEGEVRSIGGTLLEGPEIEAIVSSALTPHALKEYQEVQIADSSYRLSGVGRFRINLHRQQGQAAAAIRALPTKVPAIKDLNLPPSVESLAHLPRGLVLIGGPAGSGKTTTLAALVHAINQSKPRHIITIEDPIEYEHLHLRGLVEQVEIGLDAPDFPTALRAAVRQAPDVIVVGEMRDSETMRIAVRAAETGHLVLSTVHTTDVASAVSRISDSFPLQRQNAVRQELAMALAAVLTQVLLPSRRGGRVPAAELLMLGYAGRQHIRRNTLQHLHQEITMTKNKGSFTLEESLAQLIKSGSLEREDALIAAFHPDDLNSILRADPLARM